MSRASDSHWFSRAAETHTEVRQAMSQEIGLTFWNKRWGHESRPDRLRCGDKPAAHGTVGFQASRGTCPRGQGAFWFLKSHPSVRFSVILFANLLSFQDDIFSGDFSHLLMNSVKHLLVTLSGLMVVITLHD